MARKDELGRWGETVAGDFLVANGYEVLDRGWRCRHGEIDLIARYGRTVAFVEVKTRRTGRYGHPLEAITSAKFARLRVLAGEWCRVNRVHAGTVRIDAIGIIGDGLAVGSLEHRVGVIE
jgi:putative endonuclease